MRALRMKTPMRAHPCTRLFALWTAPIVAMVTLLTATGCHHDNSAQEAAEKRAVVEKHRPEAEASIKAIVAMAKKDLSLANGALTYSGEPLSERRFGDGNLAVITASVASNLDTDAISESDTVFGYSFILGAAAQELLHPEGYYRSPSQYEDDLNGLNQIKYVLLIKPLECHKPAINGDNLVPGFYRGEAYLFDLTGKSYGGVAFQGGSSTTVEYREQVNQKTRAVVSSSADREVDNDFCNNVRKACQAALAGPAAATGVRGTPPLITIDTSVY